MFLGSVQEVMELVRVYAYLGLKELNQIDCSRNQFHSNTLGLSCSGHHWDGLGHTGALMLRSSLEWTWTYWGSRT